jgi:glycosyltransferase involved in cell wall biosynthesis
VPLAEGITVVIPTPPSREQQLGRAIASVAAQLLQPVETLVEPDWDREGPAIVRNRALAKVTTEWVAFLDDDDELYPNHLLALARFARLTPVDVVYPYFDCDGEDVIRMFGVPFDPLLLERANFIPVTALARTAKVREAGGFQLHLDGNGDPCEDWGLWLAMHKNGAKFAHLPARTWRWHNNEGTRGHADRW